MGDSFTEHRDIHNAQWEANSSIDIHMNDDLSADREDKEREAVYLGQ